MKSIQCCGCGFLARTGLLESCSLPTPEDLTQSGFTPELFHRLSVAYGLTFDLGRIYTAGETEDFTRPTALAGPDRDELYPE